MKIKYAIFILYICFLLNASVSLCQNTIAAKKKIVIPEKIKKLSYFFTPILGYKPETNFIFGGVGIFKFNLYSDEYDKRFNRPSTVFPSLRYSLNRQFIFTLESDIYLSQGMNINIYPRYSLYPDVFYGTGAHTKTENSESYTDENYTFTSNISGIFFKKEFIGIIVDIKDHELFNLEHAKMLDTLPVAGKSGGFYTGAGLSFRHDTRDDIFYPSKGYFIKFEGVYYPDFSFNNYHFSNISLDYRHIFSLINSKNILAFQACFNMAEGITVPFYELKGIGGDSQMRGIHAKRYVDKIAYYAQVEFRRFLFWRISAVSFGGIGDVSHVFSAFRINDFKYNYGLGLRFRVLKDEKLNFRFDVGFGPDKQKGIYLEAKEAF
ncbi:MAG: BamA/TamA family outer membrane protein [Bacteroidia bacterium]|nr:BamA/TamA family outer membrane protein [Bacteroidia bacterium]